MKGNDATYLRLLLAAIVAAIVTACASMGRPEGGPRDVDPPVFVRSNPYPGQVNVGNNKVTIEFNENIQIKDIMSKVVISPPQQVSPIINANGHRLTVELRDTMKPNTTYTLDFTDAISDLNEGNEIDGFAFAFSTGETIDSLQISGMVLQAENLEPAQGVLVGVYSNLSDTAITTLPFERLTRTNQLGQFILRNLKDTTYRIFALNDMNRDYHWDRSEDVAFYDMLIRPTATATTHTDTLQASDGTDSIVTHPATSYGPNDVLLTWFNENYKAQYMTKHERQDSNKIYLEFNTLSDSLPELTILNGKYAGQRLDPFVELNYSATLDSIEYWIKDTVLIRQDSLLLETRYLRTDTNDQITWTTDTIYYNYRGSRNKKQEKSKRSDEQSDSLGPQLTFLDIKAVSSSTQDVHLPAFFTTGVPVMEIDQNGIHLEILDDTTWIEVMPPTPKRVQPGRPMRYMIEYEWEPGAKYRFSIDSAAVTDMYGHWNRPYKQEFTVRNESDYSSITFNISGINEPAVVQLLKSNDTPMAAEPVIDGKAIFLHLRPDTYYARLFIDKNQNGIYDSGALLDSIQPEDVYYYPKKIPLKEKWDAVQTWDVNELPVDMQKPSDIKKNKPKLKAGEMPEQEEDEEDENEFFAPGTINGNYNTNSNNNRNSNRVNNGRFRTNDLR